MRNSNKVIFINILSTFVLQGAAMLTAPLFSRWLGAENYGIASVFSIWSSVFLALFSLRCSDTLQMAKLRFPNEEQSAYQSNIFGLGTLCFLIATGIVLIFISPISRWMKMSPWMVVAVIISAYGQFCVGILNGKFTFEFKAGSNCILSVANVVISITLSVILIKSFPAEQNYWGRILGVTISYACLAVFSGVYLIIKGRSLFNFHYWKFALPLGLPMVFHSMSILLLGQSDRIMLQHITSDAAVGIYSLASTFALALNLIWGALNSSWNPFFVEFIKKNDEDALKNRGKNYIEVFTVLACGFVLLTNEVYHVFADKTYWGGTNVVHTLAIGYYFVFLYSLAVNYEFCFGKTRMIAIISIVTAVINVVLNYFLIMRWEYLGAAIATMIAHLFQFLFHYFGAKYVVKDSVFPYDMKFLLPYTMVFLAVAAFSILGPQYWYVRWPLGAAIGVWELCRIIKRKQIF